MKYMHFHFSCSFAGLANMLEEYGIDTEDAQIVLGIKLPYMLDQQEGHYLAGPMLQTKEWQNIYLKPLGFEMEEKRIHKEELLGFIKGHAPCMLGVRTIPEAPSRHAVVFMGEKEGKLTFLNNKREESDEADFFCWSEEEFLRTIDREQTMVGYLKKCEPETIDLSAKFEKSLHTLSDLKKQVMCICQRTYSKSEMKEMQDKVFRAVFLDNISVLRLVDSNGLTEKFEVLQKQFLQAMKTEKDMICLREYLDLESLKEALGDWKELIKAEREKCISV